MTELVHVKKKGWRVCEKAWCSVAVLVFSYQTSRIIATFTFIHNIVKRGLISALAADILLGDPDSQQVGQWRNSFLRAQVNKVEIKSKMVSLKSTRYLVCCHHGRPSCSLALLLCKTLSVTRGFPWPHLIKTRDLSDCFHRVMRYKLRQDQYKHNTNVIYYRSTIFMVREFIMQLWDK